MVPGRGKNVVLLLASLVFYAWGELRYTLLMLVMITQGYVFGRLIDSKRRWSKLFLTTSVVISLGVLGYFKYAGFFLESFGAVTGLAVPVLKVTLPGTTKYSSITAGRKQYKNEKLEKVHVFNGYFTYDDAGCLRNANG